jgi:uncharacterized membrane protein
VPFIDNLALELLTLVMVSGIALYTILSACFEYRRKGAKNVSNVLRDGVIPLAVLGLLITILALWSEMVWPFPGANAKYNIVFSDPYLILGIVLIAISIAIYFRRKLQVAGFLALMAGFISVLYGVEIYINGLTSSPFAAFGMYFAYGIAGILVFPATLLFDSINSGKKPSIVLKVLTVLLILAFIVAAIAAGLIGVESLAGHIISTP